MIARKPTRGRTALAIASSVATVALSALLCADAAQATSGTSWWRLNSTAAPSLMPRHGKAEIVVTAINLGYGEVSAGEAQVTLTDELPQGVKAESAEWARVGNIEVPSEDLTGNCSRGQVVVCRYTGKPGSTPYGAPVTGGFAPYEGLSVRIHVSVNAEEPAETSLSNVVQIEGGQTPSPEPLKKALELERVEGEQTPFGVESEGYVLTPEGEDGSPADQAGSHPFQLTTTVDLNQTLAEYDTEAEKGVFPSAPALPRDLHFKLPPGLVADADAVPRCSDVEFATILLPQDSNACPADTAIGVANVLVNIPVPVGFEDRTIPVFNLVPAPGEPARFGFETSEVPVVLNASLPAGGDYAAEVTTSDTSQVAQFLSSQVTIWGVPGDPRHDAVRGWECLDDGFYLEAIACTHLHEQEPPAFLTLPTSCEGPLPSSMAGDSWPTGEPGNEGSALAPENTTYKSASALSGCSLLGFDPSIAMEPEQHAASTPTGLNVDVTMAQAGLVAQGGLAESALRETTVALPRSMQLNPSAANALEACSAFDFGSLPVGESEGGRLVEGLDEQGSEDEFQTADEHFTTGPSDCPDAAKVGTVNITTPLLEGELTGSVYLAAQNTDPFGGAEGDTEKAPLALYLTAEDPSAGVLVKLAGEVKVNRATGQLTSTFRSAPQVPFSDLELHFFGGPRGALSTPPLCSSSYTAEATFTPWSGAPAATRSPGFEITAGAGGGACPPSPLPFDPAFTGGASNTQAGGFTPFTVTVGQADGAQPLERIDLHLPAGIAALISSVTPCPEAQVAADACGPESLVGHTTAVAGLGSEPVTLGGEVYLTGALRATAGHPAAPFGLLAVTHAAVGPFDLGDVTVLSTFEIDPSTAAVTVQSEPIPQRIDGVPVDLKQLQVTVERPGNAPFEFNPTSCNPFTITGALSGYEGGSLPLSYPFQATNCASLPFAPKLTASAGGHGSKAGGTNLDVKVESGGVGPTGVAQENIAKVDLTIPAALPSRLTTIQKACPAPVFEAGPASCDEGSVIGEATVHTPVLKNPLKGPGYLVSHGGAEFPDVEFVLQGEGVTVVLDGKTDIKKGVTYSKFESAPDVPFTTFETVLPAGPHSAFTPNVPEKEDFSLCKTKLSMPTTITGQNGKVIEQDTQIAITGCGAVKSSKARKLTLAQRLANALAQCRGAHRRSRKERTACERTARRLYTAKKAQRAQRR